MKGPKGEIILSPLTFVLSPERVLPLGIFWATGALGRRLQHVGSSHLDDLSSDVVWYG